MESTNILSCPNCKDNFKEVFMFPCMHNFCSICTNLMENGAETICLICSNSCHQDEIKRNSFLEKICLIKSQNKNTEIDMIICELCDTDSAENQVAKYCVNCSQYICLKCSARHIKTKLCKDHEIIDKNSAKNTTYKCPEPFCEKHKQNFSIYCNTCNTILCGTCCSIDLLHSKHDKSDNLEVIFAKSNSDIKNKVSEIDNIVKHQKKLIEDNKQFETNLFQNCDKVVNKIENYAKELKDQIDKLTKANVDKIISIKNDFIKSIQENVNEITDYISLLTNLNSYFHEVINKGSNVDAFNSKNELNKITWIETKQSMLASKLIPKIELFFQKPSIDSLFLTELSESIKAGLEKNQFKAKEMMTFSASQLQQLEDAFARDADDLELIDLASKLDLTEFQVQDWFDNQRIKVKPVQDGADSQASSIKDGNVGISAATTVSSANIATTVSLANIATTVTPSNIATTVAPANIATTVTPSNIATTVTPANIATTVTPSSIATTVSPANIATTVTPSSIATTVSPANIAITVTPSNIATTVSPAVVATTVTPAVVATTNPTAP